jgi:methylmalonyl-CoA/ethylmalonyl-CoA epimerase
LRRHGEGIQQLALEVDNLEISCAAARKNGIRVVYDESRSGSNGSKINFLHPKSTTGALIELVQKNE